MKKKELEFLESLMVQFIESLQDGGRLGKIFSMYKSWTPEMWEEDDDFLKEGYWRKVNEIIDAIHSNESHDVSSYQTTLFALKPIRQYYDWEDGWRRFFPDYVEIESYGNDFVDYKTDYRLDPNIHFYINAMGITFIYQSEIDVVFTDASLINLAIMTGKDEKIMRYGKVVLESLKESDSLYYDRIFREKIKQIIEESGIKIGTEAFYKAISLILGKNCIYFSNEDKEYHLTPVCRIFASYHVDIKNGGDDFTPDIFLGIKDYNFSNFSYDCSRMRVDFLAKHIFDEYFDNTDDAKTFARKYFAVTAINDNDVKIGKGNKKDIPMVFSICGKVFTNSNCYVGLEGDYCSL